MQSEENKTKYHWYIPW